MSSIHSTTRKKRSTPLWRRPTAPGCKLPCMPSATGQRSRPSTPTRAHWPAGHALTTATVSSTLRFTRRDCLFQITYGRGLLTVSEAGGRCGQGGCQVGHHAPRQQGEFWESLLTFRGKDELASRTQYLFGGQRHLQLGAEGYLIFRPGLRPIWWRGGDGFTLAALKIICEAWWVVQVLTFLCDWV